MIDPHWVNPFAVPGAWRRANLHAHTTHSDGKVTLQERVNEYALQGYDVLAITDHHLVTPFDGLNEPESMLVIPGAELHPANPYGGSTYHFVCLGLREQIDAKRTAHPQEVIDAVRAQGGLAYAAHPYWCRHTLGDLAPLEGLAGVEVYNYNCLCDGRADSTVNWDDLLNKVRLCPAIAVDDCHDPAPAQVDTFGAWTWIRAHALTLESVLEALRNGLNYASAGPEIKKLEVSDVSPDGKRPVPGQLKTHKIRVRTSPAREILFVSSHSGGRTAARIGKTVEEAEYIVKPGARYVRVEVVDREGRRAWSNPIPFVW